MCAGKWIWGLFFIAIGGLLIADTLGYVEISLLEYVPLLFGVFLGVVGLSIIFAPRPKFPCSSEVWDSMDWEENDEIREEIADAVEGVSKKVAKKLRKGTKKKTSKKRSKKKKK